MSEERRTFVEPTYWKRTLGYFLGRRVVVRTRDGAEYEGELVRTDPKDAIVRLPEKTVAVPYHLVSACLEV